MTTTSSGRLASPVSDAAAYELRTAGHLDDHWSARFDARRLDRNEDGTTTLTVDVADQAQLHGVLAGIRDIGVRLLSLTVVDPSGGTGSDGETRRPNPQPAAAARTEPAVPPLLERALRTTRLTLRPAAADDAEATWRFRQLETVNRWVTGVPADFDAYREMFVEPARLSTTVIIELNDDLGGHLIGDFMLGREDSWSQREVIDQARGAQAELGWVLDPAHTGSGYATEAVRELLRYCFEDLGVRRVTASCFLDNDASWRLMERVGMRRELHAVRESLHRSGQWLDTVAYAILVDEWTMRSSR